MRLPNELGTKSPGTIAVRGCSVNICMIGAGYVGLVSAACFSEFGWSVTCIDKDAEKIEQLCRGHMPIYEPRLDELLERNLRNGRIKFSTDLGRAVAEAVDAGGTFSAWKKALESRSGGEKRKAGIAALRVI